MSVLLYGAEMWAVTRQDLRKLNAFHAGEVLTGDCWGGRLSGIGREMVRFLRNRSHYSGREVTPTVIAVVRSPKENV